MLGVVGGAFGVLLGLVVVTVLNHHGVNLPAPGATVPAILRPYVTALLSRRASWLGTPLGTALACALAGLRARRSFARWRRCEHMSRLPSLAVRNVGPQPPAQLHHPG